MCHNTVNIGSKDKLSSDQNPACVLYIGDYPVI